MTEFRILITRQPQFATELMAKINAYNGTCVCLQLFNIQSTLDDHKKAQISKILQQTQLAIFISRNAAELVVPLIDRSLIMQWATIGPGTAKYLQQYGLSPVLYRSTAPFDSVGLVEQLLSQQINLKNQQITLFTGEDGLTWLPEELQRQGAAVEVVSVYKRVSPQLSRAQIEQVFAALPGFDLILISCVTSLITLKQWADNTLSSILQIPLLVVSDRIQRTAIEMGFPKVYTAKSMSDADIMSALLCVRKSTYR